MGFRGGGVKLTPPQRILVFKYPSGDRVKDMKVEWMKMLFGGFYIKNFNVGKRFPIKHFLAIIWASKTPNYQILLGYEEGLGRKGK